MQRLNGRRMRRLAIAAGLAVLVLALWSAQSSAQPARPPFLLYGEGEPGELVTVYDENGDELGATTVMQDGAWHVSVTCAAEKVPTLSFRVDGAAAAAEVNVTGADQAEVMLARSADAATSESDEMMSDDEMTSDDEEMMEENDELMEDDDSMAEEGMSDESMSDDDEMMSDDDEMMSDDDESMLDDKEIMSDDDEMSDNGYPESGSGGLAEGGPSTGALIGTIAVLLSLVLGLGAYRLHSLHGRKT